MTAAIMESTFQTPRPHPAPGVPLTLTPSTPTLFTPLTLRSVTLQNRILVSPMCTYSAPPTGPLTGALTPFHLIHLSAFALRGAALTIIEATAVQPRGRISPNCPGLWTDAQIPGVRAVADFVHSQGHKLGIQLGHAGRKASTLPPWVAESLVGRGISVVATAEQHGWADDVWGPSELPYGPGCVPAPHAMTPAEIAETVRDFAAAAQRAVQAGVDVIELHAAHGYLLSSFLSPLSNTRSDSYGGSFTNRTRLLFETIAAVRAVVPTGMPLFVRVSATEWVPGGWAEADTLALARLLPAAGVDLLDVSSGGNNPAQAFDFSKGFQVGIAGRVRAALRAEGVTDLAIGAVGLITEADAARGIVQADDGAVGRKLAGLEVRDGEGEVSCEDVQGQREALRITDEEGGGTRADVVLVARQFLREPEWVLRVAKRLGVQVSWPVQYQRAEQGWVLEGSS